MESSSGTILYVTCPSTSVAQDLAHKILTFRYAACVNIHGPVKSLYRDQGKIHNANEYVLIIKTPTPDNQNLIQLIEQEHPYDCPCIVTLPITGGSCAFLKWMQTTTLQ